MIRNKVIQNVLVGTLLVLVASLLGCERTDDIMNRLNVAENLLELRPDSSLLILDCIDESVLKGPKIKARYALLKSIALDKNYIDTTTFDILQPAIDYYLRKGDPNEKLRTYYYKGRIHMNAASDDLAMQSYLNALEVCDGVSDSLTLARLYVAQATLFYKQYRISEFVKNNIKAGDLYGRLGKSTLQLKCYGKALDGECRLMNKHAADSIAYICREMINNESIDDKPVKMSLLMYTVSFGNQEGIRDVIGELEEAGIDDEAKMNLARAYTKIMEPKKGLQYLIETTIAHDDVLDSLTYWSVMTYILESLGEEKRALDAFRNYSRMLEIYHDSLFSNELLFSEKKHKMEIESIDKLHRKENVIKWILVVSAILICLTGFIYYWYRLNRVKRLIAEQNAKKLQLESEKLRLETANMRLEIGQLEGERERLLGLLEQRDELPSEMKKIIRERLEMLNGLLAKEISNEESYAKQFRQYVSVLKKDKKKFIDSTRTAFQASHPEFIAYLEDHGLTEDEIKYVCLYAIGLRGKEVGNYIELKRHYNVSCDIRRKLCLETNGTNLGPYIRKLMKEM